MTTARNASACVGKQRIMVAITSTEHSYWLALAFVDEIFTQQTQAFEEYEMQFFLNFCILALGSGQRLLYRLGSGSGLVLVLAFY